MFSFLQVIKFLDHTSRATHRVKKNIVKDVFATHLQQKIEGFKAAIPDSFVHCQKKDLDSSQSNIENLNLMEFPVKNKESTPLSLKDGEKAIKQPIERKATRVSGPSTRQLNYEREEV